VEKKTDKLRFGGKIILGFLLAIFFVIGVSLITYFSIRNLLSTVENLTEPNEKLQQLNGLLADVYLLDMSRGERTTEVDEALEEALNRIDERILWLKNNAALIQDVESYEKIHHNVRELLIGYAGLEEVRLNLNNRNFTQEALDSIEKKIRRLQQSTELASMERLTSREYLNLIKPNVDNVPSTSGAKSIVKQESAPNRDERLLRNLRRLYFNEQSLGLRKEKSDSLLIALKAIVRDVFADEQALKNNLTQLETQLMAKNKEIFLDIQQLVSSMQRDLLLVYLEKNQSAYNLSYSVSVILGLMVVFVIISSFGFVWNILKEIKRAHIYQTQLEEAKVQSEKLAKAKQNFLANMSHEIRNPLHTIQGYQQALSSTKLNAEQKGFLEMIGFASQTLISIVNDILDFSKLEAGKINVERKAFDPLKFFQSLKQFFELKAQDKILIFDWHIDFPQQKWIKADDLRITQIMSNLLSNSIKFTDAGGIYVETYFDAFREQLVLKVKDTGMGIPKDLLNVIFQEFNQGDTSVTRKYGGTGLGLSIVKKLVVLQGGDIQIKSEIGIGTEIVINIPVGLEVPQEVKNNPEQDFTLKGKSIMIVDDDKIGLNFLKMLLERHQAIVTAFEGGIDFEKNFIRGNFDLAILDLQMPEVGGEQVLRKLRENDSYFNLPILAMTANVFVEEQSKILDLGFNGLIFKPFDQVQILKKIIKILESKTLVEKKNTNNHRSKKKSFDLSDILQFCMNDENQFLEIMEDWLKITKKDKERLQKARDQYDLELMQSIAHQLGSRLAQIKSNTSGIAYALENQIKAGATKTVLQLVDKLIVELEFLLLEISQKFGFIDNAD